LVLEPALKVEALEQCRACQLVEADRTFIGSVAGTQAATGVRIGQREVLHGVAADREVLDGPGEVHVGERDVARTLEVHPDPRSGGTIPAGLALYGAARALSRAGAGDRE